MPEERFCPHCGSKLEPWLGPPETGWGEILVCNSPDCPYFRSSNKDIVNKDDENNLGCRYAEDPDNGYKSFNLLAWYKF